MSIRVDGRVLRLTDTDFQDLVLGEATPSRRDALAVPDALADALAVPGVPEALEAVRSPLAVLNVAVTGRSRLMSHQAWVTPDTVALLLDVREGERQLMALPPALLASGLARLLRLGPRRVAERSRCTVDGSALADLFSETETPPALRLRGAGRGPGLEPRPVVARRRPMDERPGRQERAVAGRG